MYLGVKRINDITRYILLILNIIYRRKGVCVLLREQTMWNALSPYLNLDFFCCRENFCDNIQHRGLKLFKRLAIDGKTYQSSAGYIQASDFPFR